LFPKLLRNPKGFDWQRKKRTKFWELTSNENDFSILLLSRPTNIKNLEKQYFDKAVLK